MDSAQFQEFLSQAWPLFPLSFGVFFILWCFGMPIIDRYEITERAEDQPDFRSLIAASRSKR